MTTAAAEPRHLAALLVAHAQLVPSLTNPRKRFDEGRLKELADSMAPPVGILEPLVVRRLAVERAITMKLNPPDQFFEIIAGERRWRAAAIAKIDELPVVVRDIPDDQVIRLQLVENKNREDVHPLDEAEAMERLLKLNKAETPKSIAASIGMSERYVQNRLHYLRLIQDVKDAFRDDKISAGHVDLIMRLSPADQKRALDACFVAAFDFDGVDPRDMKDGEAFYTGTVLHEEGKDRKPVQRLVSVRELDSWIKGSIRLDVTPGSPETRFFPELREAVTPKPIPGAESVKATPVLLEVSDTYEFHPPKGDTAPAPLTRDKWKGVEGKKDRCEFTQRAVVVLGKRRAQLIDVCIATGQCKKHWAYTIGQKQEPVRAAGERRPQKEIDAEKREKAAQAKQRDIELAHAQTLELAFAEAKKKAPNTPTPALLKLIAHNARKRIVTWRDVAVEELDEAKPYGVYVGAQSFTEAKKVLALFGVNVDAIAKAAEAKGKGKVDKHTAATVASHAKHTKKKAARGTLRRGASAGIRKALAARKRKAGKKR